MSLRLPRRSLPPLFAAATAAAVAVGLTAAPGAAGQVRDNEWWLNEVHVTKAWQISRGAGVTVAVLDTGVDPTQADLSGSVTTGPDYSGSERHRGDLYWGIHGTAMAALIAGHGHGPDHGDGIIGVAPKARIMSLRVSLEEHDPLRADAAVSSKLPAAIAAGIRYAVRHGAKVIDLPLDPGAPYADGTPGISAAAGGATAERKAVSYALSKGTVLVAPAGDDGPGQSQINYPAAYPGVISVGAFDKTFTKSQFSTRRSYVTLTAPGEGVITATEGAGYTPVSSTSAASAVVAGMAALIRARYPLLTPPQVSRALTEGTRYQPAGGRKVGSGYGTADAALALRTAATIQAAAQQTANAATPSASPPQTGHLTASRSARLMRDALIGGAGLLILFSLALTLQLSRRRKRAATTQPQAKPPPRPPAARGAEPGTDAPEAAQPWEALPGESQRPQLGPVPRLAGGRRAQPDDGPPWEPAPRPETEPPWGVIEAAANGSGVAGYAHQATVENGQGDTIWRADPAVSEPPVPRDPASRPVGAAPAAGSGAPGGSGSPGASRTGRPHDAEMPAGASEPYGRPGSSDPSWPYGPGAGGTAAAAGTGRTAGSRGTGAGEPSGAERQRAGENLARDTSLPGSPRPPGAGEPHGAVISRPPAAGSPPGAQPGEARPAPPPVENAGRPADNGVSAGARHGPAAPHRAADTGDRAGAPATGPAGRWNPGAKTEDFAAVSGAMQPNAEPWSTGPPEYPGHFTAPGGTASHAGPPGYTAAPGVDTQAFPALPQPDAGAYADEDEDDRHL